MKVALRYQLHYQAISIAIFIAYFFLFAFIFPVSVALLSSRGVRINIDCFIATLIYILILALIGVRKDFKLFIQNGMSRRHIFIATLMTITIVAALLALFVILLDKFSFSIRQSQFSYVNPITHIYGAVNFGQFFLLSWLVLLLMAACGLIVGIFIDRVRGILRLVIGAGIILVPVALSVAMQLLPVAARTQMIRFVLDIVGLNTAKPHVGAPTMTCLVLTVLASAVVYLLNRRREIARMN
jgi:hypothetical protein